MPPPTPLPCHSPSLPARPCPPLSLITADSALTLSGGSQHQACARARAGALRECHIIMPSPTPWQMNHATLSDEEGEEVYVVVACEAE